MATPAASVKLYIHGQGDDPRIITVLNPAVNITCIDQDSGALEASLSIAGLPDSPVKINFRSADDCAGFVDILRRGLYDFNPTAAPASSLVPPNTLNFGWPTSPSTSGSAGDPLILANTTSNISVIPTTTTTTTAAPTTTTTTTSSSVTLNYSYTDNGPCCGVFRIYKNGSLMDTLIADGTVKTGTLSMSAGDTFYSTLSSGSCPSGTLAVNQITTQLIGGFTQTVGPGIGAKRSPATGQFTISASQVWQVDAVASSDLYV